MLDYLWPGHTLVVWKLDWLARSKGAGTWTDGRRALADVSNVNADLLADMLIKQGQDEEAERLRWFGLNLDGSIAWA